MSFRPDKMSVTLRLPSPLCLLLLLAPSAFGHFPFAYQAASYPLTSSPHLIYSSPIDGGVLLAGFSYFTKGFDGGQSEVVFVTGPDSEKQMNSEVVAMRDQLIPDSGESTGDSKPKVEESAKNQPAMGNEDMSAVDPMKVETPESATAAKSDATVATDSQKDKENASDSPAPMDTIHSQYLPVKGSGFRAPYPVLKLGGSLSYYPQLSTSFSDFAGFSDYEPNDYLRTQYPFYNQYNFHQSLYNPTYPSSEDYFVPPYPSLYKSSELPTLPTLSLTNFISDDSLQSKPNADLMKLTEELQNVIKIDRRINVGKEAETTSQKPIVDLEDSLKGDEESTTAVAKEQATSEQQQPEQSATTEQLATEKSTETVAQISSSETSPTSAEPTETSTSVGDEP